MAIVDFPDPDLPTMATVSFLFMENEISVNTWRPVSYEKLTLSNSIFPSIMSLLSPRSLSISWSSCSKISLAAAR